VNKLWGIFKKLSVWQYSTVLKCDHVWGETDHFKSIKLFQLNMTG